MPQVAALMLGMLWVYAMQVVVLAAEIRPLCQHLSERLTLCEPLCGINPRLGTTSVHMMGYDEVLLRWGYMSAWTCTDSEHLHGELPASLMGKPKWSILQNGLKGKKVAIPSLISVCCATPLMTSPGTVQYTGRVPLSYPLWLLAACQY